MSRTVPGMEKLLTTEIAEESQRKRRKAILLELLTLRVSKEDNNKSKINGDGQECPSHTDGLSAKSTVPLLLHIYLAKK